jgi:acylphosphatase
VIRVHVRVHGRVQGVYYRATTQETAQRLGLVGWVRNRSDGTVEAVAEGDEIAVESFLAWCRKGPDRAQVGEVEVERMEPLGTDESFAVRPTA